MAEAGRKPRVLLVGPVPPPMGGIQRFCIDIMSSHLAEEFDVEFFDYTIPRFLRPASYTPKRSWNIFARDGTWNVIRQITWARRRFKEYLRELDSGRYDIVHIISCTGWGFWRNAFHIDAAARRRVKAFWHVVGAIDDFWRNGSVLRRALIRLSLDRADVHVVQSDRLREITEQYTRKPVVTVYNGVRTDRLFPPDGYAHSDPARGKVRVVNLGILSHRKGHYDLIEVARRLCPKMPELEFLFVGGGEVEVFRKAVEDAGCSEWITLAGQVDDDEKVRLLQTSDIFAMPTYGEGQPIALLEGIAAGLPIISTPVGSIPEVVKEANGRLIAPGDVDALEARIVELAGSPVLREALGRRNAEEGRTKYALERTMRELGEVYSDLASGRSAPDGLRGAT